MSSHTVKTDVSILTVTASDGIYNVVLRRAQDAYLRLDYGSRVDYEGTIVSGEPKVGHPVSVRRTSDDTIYTTNNVSSVEPPFVVEPTFTTLDLSPTDEGYTNIARMFVQSMRGDIRASRRAAAMSILTSLLETTVYLTRRERSDGDVTLVQAIIDEAKRS